MKVRRVLIAVLWINLACVTAAAKTMVVRPDPCPAPADAPRVIDLNAVDLNLHRIDARSVIVLYPPQERGWASARILARFNLDRTERAPIPLACLH